MTTKLIVIIAVCVLSVVAMFVGGWWLNRGDGEDVQKEEN